MTETPEGVYRAAAEAEAAHRGEPEWWTAHLAAHPAFRAAVDAAYAAGREAEPPTGEWPEWALRAIERAQTIGIADGREAAAQALNAAGEADGWLAPSWAEVVEIARGDR